MSGISRPPNNEETQKNPGRKQELVSPGAHKLDSSVNWDKDSQRKFWNAWDTQHLQTVREETLRRGIANLLSEMGHLILTTQNRSIYMRNSRVAPPPEGQLRRRVTMRELRALLSSRFACLRSYTVEPGGNRGLLRLVNSRKFTSFLSRIFSTERVIRIKERLGLGQTLVMLAGAKTPLEASVGLAQSNLRLSC